MPVDTLIGLDRLALAAECLKTLAHPHRLRIVELLLNDRYTVGELAEKCAVPSNIASGHLRLMQRCGFLASERDGRNVYYKITDPCIKTFMGCIRQRFGAGG
jgi:DNA-binding transcriptional ArsR family regulator